jgi:hypothetical protein
MLQQQVKVKRVQVKGNTRSTSARSKAAAGQRQRQVKANQVKPSARSKAVSVVGQRRTAVAELLHLAVTSDSSN